MANYIGSLEAVYCCLSSELQSYSSSPTTRLSSPTGSATANPYPLQAVYCHIHSVRYDMAVNR
eukprot:scaffold1599_cov150-Skeletonema_marinoi.AAC.1